MLRHLYIFIIAIICLNSCSAQQQEAQTKSWMKNIATTTRVSAIHYSEMTVDKQGDTYIASYIKDTNSRKGDFIYIVKISAKGEKLWEKGLSDYGRAMSIDIDKHGQIFLAGYFYNGTVLGIKTKVQTGGFIAMLDKNGKCTNLIESKEEYFSMAINDEGNILAHSFDGHVQGKLTLHSSKGEIINETPITGTVTDIKANGSHFYIAGSFIDTHYINDKPQATTTNPYDQDGFLHIMDGTGKSMATHYTGNKGVPKDHYQSKDAVCDIAVNDKGETAFAYAVDSLVAGQLNREIYVAILDAKHNIKQQRLIANNITAAGAVSIAYANDKYYLTFSAKDSCSFYTERHSFTDKYRSYILSIDDKLNLYQHNHIEGTMDNALRESAVSNEHIYFSGHHRGELTFKKETITGGMKQQLFLIKLDL